MSVNPKVSFYLGIVISLVGLVAAGTIQFTGLIPADWIPPIKTAAIDFVAAGNVVLTALHGISSPQGGPLTGAGK